MASHKNEEKILTSEYNRNGLATALLKYKEVKSMLKKDGNNEIKTLSHSTYSICA